MRRRNQAPADVELAFPPALWTSEAASPFGMVVSSSREVSWAGVQMLESGGNAIDAAVAAAFAAGVAEPGSAGLGGQALMLVYLADGRAAVVDGAGAAPRLADRGVLWAKDHEDRAFYGHDTAVVPGTLAALSLALESYGTRTLADVLEPAIELAELGTRVPLYEHAFVAKYTRKLRASPVLCHLFLTDCWEVPPPEHTFCSPDLACTMRHLAWAGAEDFYRGSIASLIETDMIAHGGYIRRQDLAAYRAQEKEPLRGSYRGYEVLSTPYPGGGAAVVEALHILEQFPSEILATMNADRLHLQAEAIRLALSDTLPAPDHLVPRDHTAIDKSFAARRAALIRFDRALAGDEIGGASPLDRAHDDRETTQITVADAHGNVVSMTFTLGHTFGSGAVNPVLGFPYNSLLNNYDLENPNSPAYLRPRRPPFSTMAPTIVLKDGRPFLALGSAGSMRIPSAITGVITNVIDANMPLCEAVTAPRGMTGGGRRAGLRIEIVAPVTPEDANELERRGFSRVRRRWFPADVEDMSGFGSTNSILIDPLDGTLVGAGDPRRQGVALGATRLFGTRHSPVASLPCWRDLFAEATEQGTR